jgi:hypothetical protein
MIVEKLGTLKFLKLILDISALGTLQSKSHLLSLIALD